MREESLNSILFGKPLASISFEKRQAGSVLRCQLTVFEDRATILGDEIDKTFWEGGESSSLAIRHILDLGYVEAENWRLSPSRPRPG